MALYDAPGEVLGEELTSSGFPGLIFILGLMAFHRQVCVCACVHASVLACVCVRARVLVTSSCPVVYAGLIFVQPCGV